MSARSLITILLLTPLILNSGRSHAEEEGGAKVGPGKAVLAANAKDGMRLSEAAIKRLGLAFQDAKRGETQEVPPQSLVVSKEETSVYRLRGGWIKRVEVRVISRSARSVKIQSEDFKPGDRVVVSGAPFLRTAELDVLGSEKEEGDER